MTMPLDYPVSNLGTGLMNGDHQEIANLLASVRAAMATGNGKRLRALLEDLREHSLTHFGLEESLMTASRYPRAREHAKLHQRMAEALNQALEQGPATAALCGETLDLVETLHSVHLQTEDAMLSHWLRQANSPSKVGA